MCHLLFKLRLLTEEAKSEERRHQVGRCRTRSRIFNSHERVFPWTERGRSRWLNEVHQSVSLKNTLRSLSESVVSHVNFWVVGTQRGPLNCKQHQYKVSFYTKIVLNNALLVNNPSKMWHLIKQFFFLRHIWLCKYLPWNVRFEVCWGLPVLIFCYVISTQYIFMFGFFPSFALIFFKGFIIQIGYLGQETDLQNRSDCFVCS